MISGASLSKCGCSCALYYVCQFGCEFISKMSSASKPTNRDSPNKFGAGCGSGRRANIIERFNFRAGCVIASKDIELIECILELGWSCIIV